MLYSQTPSLIEIDIHLTNSIIMTWCNPLQSILGFKPNLVENDVWDERVAVIIEGPSSILASRESRILYLNNAACWVGMTD